MKEDKINHPKHYNVGIEVTDFILSWQMDFIRGNIIKYVTRCPYKGNTVEDLKKAKWYINKLIDELEAGKIPNSCY
tara:strand:+ start:179 stop:406 length:228 start_codon:yes stop_codon:yes gene_type:complete